jgi:exodeoxyribonuclease V alpha subunit
MSTTTPNLDGRVANSTQHETLIGVVERLTYHSQESGYSVARLKVPGERDLLRAHLAVGGVQS